MSAGGELDFGEFLRHISFRFCRPAAPPPWWFAGSAHRLRKVGVQLEALNMRLPANARATRRNVSAVLDMPRMSTYPIGALLNRAVASMRPEHAYVNVGIWHGYTFLAGLSGNPERRSIGIDNFSEFVSEKFGDVRGEFLRRFERFKGPNDEFHELDYRDYFAGVHRGPIGVYHYDGEHSYENQLEGLRAAEPFFVPGTVVTIDDAYAVPPREATNDFLATAEGAWEVLLDQPVATKGHPTFWNGFLVLRRAA